MTPPTPAHTHIWDGSRDLPDWLTGHHWTAGQLVIRTPDGDTRPQAGWWLIGWTDGSVTAATPTVAERVYGDDGIAGQLERAEEEISRLTAAEAADIAAGSYAGRAEEAEQQRDQLAALVRDFLDDDRCDLDAYGYCVAHSWACSGARCPHARARDVLAALDGEQPGPVTAQATGRSDPGTESAQPAAAYQQLLARLETEHAKSIHNATHATRDETRLSLDGITAGLDIAIAHALTVFEGHEARQAWTTRQRPAATEAAHNDGPSIAECAADDRRWPLQKTGE